MPSTPLQELQNIRKYIQHLMDESDYDYDDDDFDDPVSQHNWLSQTRGKFMKYVIYNLSDSTESKPISNQKQKLASFKKGIKREETAYPTLKDERYFDGFSRSLYITAKSHECEQVLDPDYTPSNAEKDLFEAKQIFMFSVFDKHLLTDMGKTIVRKYVSESVFLPQEVRYATHHNLEDQSGCSRMVQNTCFWLSTDGA